MIIPSCLQEYRSWVDVLSDHAYPMSLDTLVTAADTAAELGMPLVMGEVGTQRKGTKDMPQFRNATDRVEEGRD